MSRRCPKKNHLFLDLLNANRALFKFEPRITKITRHGVHGNFIGITPEIQFSASNRGIFVDVSWNGHCWDVIGDFECAERRSKHGFYCALCLPEKNNYYQTREALYTEHAFESFLEWCNDELVNNDWLAIYSYDDGGVTEAKLQKSDGLVASPALLELVQGLQPISISGKPSKTRDKDVTQSLVHIVPILKRDSNQSLNSL